VPQHNDIIREAFTTQATAFAANPWITDEQLLQRLVAAAHLYGSERVLDVATGPGYVAEAFARAAREVIGVDLTEAMLSIATERTRQRGIRNIPFRVADVRNLPLDREQFDVVVCRLAVHHFEHPAQVLAEMVRVCRTFGTVLIEDIFASVHPDRAAYQDRFESLRDPSHVRALPLTALLNLFRDADLEIDAITMNDRAPEVDRWFATSQTPPDRAAEVRRLLEDDRLHDFSGTRPFYDAGGRLQFHALTAILTGRKFRAA
jgi:SAM-dependent methyltransferase